jgi:hypothetical protein
MPPSGVIRIVASAGSLDAVAVSRISLAHSKNPLTILLSIQRSPS